MKTGLIKINDLEKFRKHWSGRRILDLIAESGGKILITWPIGVGKSHNLDELVEVAIRSSRYDLVVVLLPTRRVLNERRWIKSQPLNVRVVNLKPRPHRSCGEDANRQWKVFESQGMGLLGRRRLCAPCPSYQSCFWPDQYGRGLLRAKVIFGTQTHLERNPLFIMQLLPWTRARNPLVIIDESNFISRSMRRRIRREHIGQFLDVLGRVEDADHDSDHLIRLLQRFQTASQDDLREQEWSVPPLLNEWMLMIQERGYEVYGSEFHFILYELRNFSLSRPESRGRDEYGNLLFTPVPFVDSDLVVYSGTVDPDFAMYRLGIVLPAPFAGQKFIHPETRWYNIASCLGMRKYFRRHSKQIFDFFSILIARRLTEGKRVLLVSKKDFRTMCIDGIQAKLEELGVIGVCIIKSDWDKADLSDPKVIPIINYGMVGINLFQDYDAAYCLNGYYVNEQVLNAVLRDAVPPETEIPILFSTSGSPLRRTARLRQPCELLQVIERLVPKALHQQEMDTVLQAVGRVRPYTSAREVITFQCASHPHLNYTKEFNNINDARTYFGISKKRDRQKDNNKVRIKEAKKRGLTQRKVAEELGLGLRTVKRYWK